MASGVTLRTTTPSFPVYNFEKPTLEELKIGLQNWCQEKEGTPEYESRLKAATFIEDCYTSESDELILAGLNLTSLPEEIGALESLQYLDLRNNRLTILPMSLSELVRLDELILDNNPMDEVPLALYSVRKSCSISTKGCRLDLSILTPSSGYAHRLATSWEPNFETESSYDR